MNHEYQSGWTLIELIGTLSMITILIALLFPSLIPVGHHLEQQMYSSLIVDELLYAQIQALSSQENIRVMIQNDHLTIAREEFQLRQLQFPAHLHLKTNFPQQQLTYQEQGHTKGGTIYLYRGSNCIAEIRIQVASGTPKVISND
ncbi:Type II secretory pathway, pseudopilin PulG [Seinonella peptonophila]|uniref:Type II secretory pathway, pseudopilin PulG n=1 Tax=Seinonella peptonophila TaxID=112248 RepID=A0A1M4V4G3_9BACL|nr:type II secretion system protein [Seinonella peptonophila]SHE63782.1 Type II secretory pathway, pseudopilin PulG [Seinonella peptonophila]